MGYPAHLQLAFGIGATMIAAGAACCIHGVFPGLFQDRASRTVEALHRRMRRAAAGETAGPGTLEFEI